MKKIYAAQALLIGLPALITAQNTAPKEATAFPVPQGMTETAAAVAAPQGTLAYGDTIWSEDFASGMPGTWTMANNTGNNWDWIYSATPNFTCTYTNVTVASTSAGNGFMLMPAEKYSSDAACQNLIGYNNVDAYIQTPAINCSAYGSVILKFQQAFRYCCTFNGSQMSVFVSNDGTNWTEWKVKKGLSFNVASPNPDNVTLNISSVAAGQSTVYLRFHMYGASHYYWAVDDVALVEGPSDDMELVEELADFNFTYGGYYTRVPARQAGSSAITWRAAVMNNGSNSQTGVTLNVDVSRQGTGSVYNQSSSPKTIAPVAADTLSIPTPFTDGTKGQYTFTFSIGQNETDQETANNSKAVSYEVTDSVYARDDGIDDGGVGPHSFTCCTTDGSEIATEYDITVSDVATSISFFVRPSTSPSGVSVFANLYPPFGTVPLGQSDIYDIDSTDHGTWVTIPFLAPASVLKDSTYFASLAVFGLDLGLRLWVGDERVVNQPSTSVDPNTWVYGGQWYWVPNQPMIRLNTQSSVGLGEKETDISLGAFPNPSGGAVYIAASVAAGADPWRLSVENILGQEIYSETVDAPAGTFSRRIELAGQGAGIYLVRVAGRQSQKTIRLIVR